MSGRAQIVAAIPLPIDITDLAKESKRLHRQFGEGLIMGQQQNCILVATPGEGDPLGCWCWECDDARSEVMAAAGGRVSRFMILCPDCGNKRCPKANHHDNACTGSNEPGQPGSAYPGATS